MLCSTQDKGSNYFQTKGTKFRGKGTLLMKSTSNAFQRKYENYNLCQFALKLPNDQPVLNHQKSTPKLQNPSHLKYFETLRTDTS